MVEETGFCSICGDTIDWREGGNACARCSEPVCETHTDYAIMREIHEETGKEAVAPLCTACGADIRAMNRQERRKALSQYENNDIGLQQTKDAETPSFGL